MNFGVLLTTGAVKRKLSVESRCRDGHVKLQCFVFSYIYNVTYHTSFLTFLGNLINKKGAEGGIRTHVINRIETLIVELQYPQLAYPSLSQICPHRHLQHLNLLLLVCANSEPRHILNFSFVIFVSDVCTYVLKRNTVTSICLSRSPT